MCWLKGLGCRVWDLGCRGFVFSVQGFRIKGLGRSTYTTQRLNQWPTQPLTDFWMEYLLGGSGGNWENWDYYVACRLFVYLHNPHDRLSLDLRPLTLRDSLILLLSVPRG